MALQGNLKINRLQVLVEVFSSGEILFIEMCSCLGIHPTQLSKLVARWTPSDCLGMSLSKHFE